MKKFFIFFLLLSPILIFSQNEDADKKDALIFTPEFFLGITTKSNEYFPKTTLQKQAVFSLGRLHIHNPQEWAQRLNHPKTGISFGYTDFGNLKHLGVALTLMPFIEFKAFRSKRFKVLTGVGASYFNKKFDVKSNPNNRAVTTDFTWAFRLNLYYQFYSTPKIDWRFGLGYSHHSNGHTRLFNQGYNSFLAGISADIKQTPQQYKQVTSQTLSKYVKTRTFYYSVRAGLGQNVLAVAFNDRKNVYTIAGEYGHIYNHTFKIGLGFYYRFYQHYYDYIEGNESLVQDGRKFDYFKDRPFYYASNLGLSIHGEVLLNHIGINAQIGFNLYKPGYKLDYIMNKGWDDTPREIPENWVLGELDSTYKKKKLISSRLGLKYYLIGMEKSPKNDIYIGSTINTNFGQADFIELSLGYVHSFNFKQTK